MQEKPSEIIEYYWIYADNLILPRPRNYPKEKIGKWLIFIKRKNIDEVWEMIRNQTQKGFLGINSKVSTAKPNSKSQENQHVICIYTKDFEDKGDIFKIEKRIRKLGIKEDLFYKTNQQTYGEESILCESKIN